MNPFPGAPMRLQDFDFPLPEALIAQTPLPDRDGSRLMVVHRATGTVACRTFPDVAEHFGPGDLLVLNESKVIPARLIARKESGGAVEILLLRRISGSVDPCEWEVLLRPGKRVREGTRLYFTGRPRAEVISRVSPKCWVLRFDTGEPFERFLDREGQAPLPPYIRRTGKEGLRGLDLERYQTVYARVAGSVAAPTAGLHFTERTLGEIGRRGAETARITLHVGLGTFQPVETETVEEHRMEPESFEMTEETLERLREARRVTAVGTTSTRVIETVFRDPGGPRSLRGSTGLYIYPGFPFRRVDRLLTNFHLPRSSLFLLVCAFAGRELMLRAYGRAVEEGFRFYSYGDAMLIL
ncbi:MAG TPA: tRNA preQ1(34) S-adenosylmethionine ribosyltransferase-isomerase QueA [Syntrophales bacterium]|nr:tRNA preQ1(34) S-adenosylmethionine ribosyltransferase-isomerase QueA [Syntrophales bacterium]HQQ28493.1 tRNA preQ1(34) S-adenosylmethionine ribosyltransferase-isomerase QueA [Syntrophales bacterium]